MIIGKKYTFEAAHHLPNHPKCGKIHGHTYTLTVELEGPIDSRGVVMDFYDLNQEIQSILQDLDHTYLNTLLDWPTVEVITAHVYAKLTNAFREGPIKVNMIQIQEGEGGYAKITHPVS